MEKIFVLSVLTIALLIYEIIKTKSTSMTAVAIKEVPFAWRDI